MIPPFWDYYKSRPDCYIQGLLGHESKGSILYYLKENGLATGLSASPTIEHTRSWFSLGIQVKLTKKGLEEIWTVIQAIFAYVSILKSPCEHFYNEIKRINDLHFEYFTRMETIDYCTKISESLQHFPPDRVLTAGIYDLVEEINQDHVNHMLEFITFERSRIDITSISFENEASLTEPWFGTKYCIKNIPILPQIEGILSKVFFPSVNEFIPTNFDVVDIEDKLPVKVYESDMIESWYNTDISFGDSRAYAYIALLIPNFRSTALRSVTADIIANVLENDMNDEFGYQATEAGFNISVEALDNAFEIKIGGFSDKLGNLIERIMDHIYSSFPNENTIRLVIEEQIEKFKNANLNPRSHSRNSRLVFLQHQQYLEDKKYEVIRELASSELIYNLAHVKVLLYVTGNLKKQDVIDTSEYIEGLLFAAEGKRVKNFTPRTVLLIPDGILEWKLNSLDQANNCSVIEMYFQFGQATVEERALTALLEQTLEEESFDELRTIQQLGYYVSASSRMTRGISGFLFKICSTEYSPDTLMDKIIEYLTAATQRFGDSFKEHKKSVISRRKEPFHTLAEKSEFFWDEIMQGNFEFKRREKEIEFLKNLKLPDFTS